MQMTVLQEDLKEWNIHTFGEERFWDIRERALRVLEEAIELAQACDVDQQFAEELLKHVYSKPPGDPKQELGGVSTTLFCAAAALKENLHDVTLSERMRIWQRIDEIRQKNLTKIRY